MRGPGDVIGIARGQVVRTDPIDGAVGVEPNYFAQIEFDRPDLPWLFTPAAAVGERLRPWIVLVVVDARRARMPARSRTGSPLPRAAAFRPSAAAQLPDLARLVPVGARPGDHAGRADGGRRARRAAIRG